MFRHCYDEVWNSITQRQLIIFFLSIDQSSEPASVESLGYVRHRYSLTLGNKKPVTVGTAYGYPTIQLFLSLPNTLNTTHCVPPTTKDTHSLILIRSAFNAFSIGICLVVAVLLCVKREAFYSAFNSPGRTKNLRQPYLVLILTIITTDNNHHHHDN